MMRTLNIAQCFRFTSIINKIHYICSKTSINHINKLVVKQTDTDNAWHKSLKAESRSAWGTYYSLLLSHCSGSPELFIGKAKRKIHGFISMS